MSNDSEMSEPSTGKRRMWATPRSYSYRDSHTPGLTTLDIQVRGLYPEEERYHGVNTASPQLTLFAEASPVSRTPLLADEAHLRMTATSGPTSLDSFAKLDRDGWWLKTSQGYCQASLDGSLERFSETWPRAGMTRNGIAYLRQPSAPLTDATESGSWPTPTVSDVKGTTEFHPRKEAKFETKHAVTLAQYVQWQERQTWPTPRAEHDSGGHRGSSDTLHSAIKSAHPNSGALNPTWVEALMGYPHGWTDVSGVD
jgi:hypothetical protein